MGATVLDESAPVTDDPMGGSDGLGSGVLSTAD